METIYAQGTPLAHYLEGEGSYEPESDSDLERTRSSTLQTPDPYLDQPSPFAPPNNVTSISQRRNRLLTPLHTAPSVPKQAGAFDRVHDAWSTAVNSRLGRADNAKFLEHFRYILVASQLLNEFLDQGSLQPSITVPNGDAKHGLDGTKDEASLLRMPTDMYGAAGVATVAFALVYLIHWARSSQGQISKSKVALVLTIFAVVAMVGYAYMRREWLKYLRQQAVGAASGMTSNWQAFEVTSTSALSLIQEVELVSKGYRLTTPLPPASRLEESGTSRRCARLRKVLHKTYIALIPACIEAITTLRTLIDEDDLDKYFDVYDISAQDAKEAIQTETLSVLEDDPESLKSLRVLSYRACVLRRVTLCSLMALEADGGKPDIHRWRIATEVIDGLSRATGPSAEKIRTVLTEMETLNIPATPLYKTTHTPTREKMRSQVRKISALSSGIRGLQAKMQFLREETNLSIEASEDLADLGPNLMAQYDSIGTDLKELVAAWEQGKASLQSNITKRERRLSLASSGVRSPVSSLGGLTAVEEDGSPADALRTLTGEKSRSNRSSTATTPSEEEHVFEAIALPRQRTSLTREERIVKMHEEREKQASARARHSVNTNMLKELESVINLRPKKNSISGATRITSI